MSKFKKFLLLIPTIAIMLLNCMSFTVYAEDTTEAPTVAPTEIDYQSYYLDPEETIPEVLDALDFRKIENFPKLTEIPEKYAFLVYADIDNYNNYLAGSSTLNLTIQLFDLTDAEYKSNYYSMLTTKNITFKNAIYKFDSSGLDSAGTFYNNNSRAIYSFESEYFGATTSSVLQDVTVYSSSRYRFYFETNVEEFGYVGDALDVKVSVEPELSLNHRFSYSEASSISPGFTLTITNNSKRPIQYTMNIHSKDETIFKYYKYDWVYTEVDSKITYVNKSTCHHYVPAKSSDSIFFSYQNINFEPNVVYYLYVQYCFSLDDSATELFTNQSNQYHDYFPNSDFAAEKYNDGVWFEFSFLDFPFLYKRPSTSDSLYLPYDSEIDQERYETSYNASLNDDGTIDYSGKAPDDFYVWDNNEIIHSSSGIIGGSSSGSSNDGTFKSFASSFNSFFKFINYLFNYLPVGLKNLFLCGFTGIIVIAFVKKVF